MSSKLPGDAFTYYTSSYDIDPQVNIFVFISLAVLCTSVLHYAVAIFLFSFMARIEGRHKRPPLVPSVVPLLGNMPFKFLWNPRKFVCSSRRFFWSSHPVRVRLLAQDFYILQGTKNILALFRQRHISAFVMHGFLLRNVFRLPKAATTIYHNDNSGEYPTPNPNSNVESRNRVDFLTRSSFQRFLTGPGLAPLSKRFQRNITKRIQSLSIGNDWLQWDDFMDLFHNEVTSAILDSMCGTSLMELNPSFNKILWALDHNVMTLFTKTPKILAPEAHSCRDSALAAIKNWHTWARENFDPASIGPDGDDPYWGTKFFRDRQGMFYGMEGFDADAVASEELAFIWGANTNAVIAGFWSSLEVFQDSELLDQVRREVQSCVIEYTKDDLRYDIDRLLEQPILQAVYAETLRLRVNGFLIRYPSKEDLKINGWSIPKKHFILTSSTPGHMNPDIWCTGSNKNHPTEEFWPGRWLKHSEDRKLVEFSTETAKGAWMPFGGGSHMCPGRHFAKLEIILIMALLVTMYDCEVLADKKNMEMSTRNFGFGSLSPAGKVPVRIRRRSGL